MRSIRRKLIKGSPRLACSSKQGHAGRRRQRDVLCAVMLSADECDTWLTLDELAKLTRYPPASISAQLRHLLKPQFGGYALQKRPRRFGRVLHGEDVGTVWEYQLRRTCRSIGKSEIEVGKPGVPAEVAPCR